MIFNMTGGGGGVAVTVEYYKTVDALPYVAKENTIAVITDTIIPSYIFSDVAPVYHATGMAWFNVNGGSVTLNVDRNKLVVLHPQKVQQWNGSEWVSREAHVFQNGKWVSFASAKFFIYDKGNEIYTFTTFVAKEDSTHGAGKEPTITRNDTSITFSLPKNTSQRTCCIAYPDTKVDLSKYSKIKVEYNCDITSTVEQVYLTLHTQYGTYLRDNMVKTGLITAGSGTLEVDVSDLTGEHYIGFWLYTYTTNGAGAVTLTVNSLWLE